MKRIAVVTGAGGGIGGATASALARDGFVVALADLNLDAATRAISALPGEGHAAFQVDVADERSVEELFRAVNPRSVQSPCLLVSLGGRF